MLLIIHKNEKNGAAVREMFRYMNVTPFACHPEEAARELSPRYRAVLILDPETFPDIKNYVTSLRATMALTPVFAMSSLHLSVADACLFAKVFSYATLSSSMAKEMVKISLDHGLPAIGDYRLAGLNVSADRPFATFCGKEVPLTATEIHILQVLIRTYPSPTSAKEIIKYAFNPQKMPGPSGVRTHICAINRKFRAMIGKPLTENRDGGYRIVTPELKALSFAAES